MIPQERISDGLTQLEYDALGGEDELAEDAPVKILEEQAAFKEVILWGHESTPDENDPYVKGIQEWIAFAETVCGILPRCRRGMLLTFVDAFSGSINACRCAG